jgi:hypothetical protein
VYKLVKSRSDVEPVDQDGQDEDEEKEEDGGFDAGLARSADPVYQKKVEDEMQKWLEATTCRQIIVDVYFNNPCRTTGMSFIMH